MRINRYHYCYYTYCNYQLSGKLEQYRIKIPNLGTPMVTPERFIDAYISRNKKLADLMCRMGFCEEKGSGLDKVIFTMNCIICHLLASIVISENRTRVTINSYKILNELGRKENIQACYQHACLKYVSKKRMTKQ